MPRPNKSRSIASEDNVARRIAYERERLKMSYGGLAMRMTAAGCPIDQSALYKIERGNPRRRISVDELVALSEVLEVPIDELLVPPELAIDRRTVELLTEYREAREGTRRAWRRLLDYVAAHPNAMAFLREHFEAGDASVDIVRESFARIRAALSEKGLGHATVDEIDAAEAALTAEPKTGNKRGGSRGKRR